MKKESSELVIRRATRDDVRRVVELINGGAVESLAKVELPAELPQSYFATFEKIDADETAHLMVGELDGKVVGTFQLNFLTYIKADGREDAQIESVHVARELRGNGIGAQLIQYGIDMARKHNCRRVQLTSNKERKDAHRFYERLGFHATHEGMKLTL